MFDENVAPRSNVTKQPKAVAAKGKGQKSIEETYTKKTQLEHILLRPDTYVGSVEKQSQPMWVFDSETKQMIFRACTFVPGLYKIFDEIIVNASDNKQRDPSMNRIDVSINSAEGYIRVWNNGNGIPVVVHQEHKIYVPELIFGNLLTGSNFDDEEEKTTGGRNGYGAKLANIFSTQFIVETADRTRGLRFKQVFRDNMGIKGEPEITKHTGEDFTCITFYPDLARFKMDSLDEDIVALFSKRVYDISGTNTAAGSKLSVYLNGTKIEARSFQQYIGLYKGLEPPCAFERVNDRWEIGVGVSDGSFQQVSFVNSICTMKGGCHVNYIADQISTKLMAIVKKRNKGQEVKSHQIKNHLAIYINALVVNPAFDSQTKENLTTKASSFGSTCTVSEKMIKAIEKSGIIDNILNWAKFKQNAELKRKGGSKKSKLIGITKLDDANCAGTSRSKDCTLILTEGDSAKALAISGLGVVGRDYYGVFPLKGKLLNVREATHQQMMKNEEIQNIAKILGLTFGRDYEDASSLRYGHLMIMTDQDHDGSHIKGLLINFLHYFWPSLLKIPGFLQQFITPIVKCTKGSKVLTFFTIPQYHNWKAENNDGKGWDIKYYKGLGTSTAAEAKEYFSHLGTHQIDFEWDDQSNDMVDMAFAKKRVDDRKLWLLGLEPGVHINYDVDRITYNDFVNKELILFSHADNERSIPHFMDGLKPSQRKVLFGCFKRNLKHEIKVVQLAGYISEHAAYHHGEVSLAQTIIGMAQNFVGSNNINFLSPCGQFGTRLMGGKDAASPRYVFTKLEQITRCIFHPDDDPLLDYLDDDGQSIEPTCYVPIIPTILVNGSEGIGTGWSTSIPTYNPREIIANIRLMIAGQQPTEMKPWFRGFIGDVQAKTGKESHNYTVAGIMEQVDDSTLLIKELPIGRWTTDYKQYLESILIGAAPAPSAKDKEEGAAAVVPAFIKDFKENHTDTTVLFTVSMAPEKLQEAIDDKMGIYKKFKLEGSVATSNMHVFDLNSQIKKYDCATDILNAFYDVRVRFYDKRKEHLIGKLTEEWEKLDNKVRFILAVISGKLVVSNRKKAELMKELKLTGFKAFVERKHQAKENEDGEADEALDTDLDHGYDYLLSMKIWSLTHERVQALTNQRNGKKAEVEELMTKTAEDLWLQDLDALDAALDKFEAEIEEGKRQELKAQNKAKGDRAHTMTGKPTKGKARGKGKAAFDSDEEDGMNDESDFSDYEGKKPAKKKVITAKGTQSALPTVTSGTLLARKIVVEKEKPAASAGASAAVATEGGAKKATKPRATAKPKKEDMDEDMNEDSDEEPNMVVSLAARLASAGLSTLSHSSSQAPATAAATKAAKKAPAAAKPTKQAPKKVAKKVDSDAEEEEDSDFDVPLASRIAASRAPRTAAVAPKVYALDDSEDEESQSDASFLSEDEDSLEEESDYESDHKPKAVKKAAAPAPAPIVPAKKAPVKTAKAVTVAAPMSPITTKGVKRATKTVSRIDSDDDFEASGNTFSPGTPSPMVVKKARQVKPAAAPAAKKAAAAKPSVKASEPKTAPVKKAAVSKPVGVPKKKGKAAASDEEEEWQVEEVISKRSPKPVRARKPQTFATYFDSEEEEDEEGVGSDEDEDEDDDFSD